MRMASATRKRNMVPWMKKRSQTRLWARGRGRERCQQGGHEGEERMREASAQEGL